MFFEMNLSCHPPVIYESEHKTDREGRKLSLESILRRIQHEPFSKRQVWRELSGSCGTVRGICQPAGQSPLSVSQQPAPQLACSGRSLLLSRLYCLNREIEQEQRRLAQLKEAATNTAVKISGLPAVGCMSDKTAIAAEIADSQAIIEAKLQLAIVEYRRINQYIAAIEDSYIRQIIALRFVDGLTWFQVAQHIGGNNTADGVRKALERFLSSEK